MWAAKLYCRYNRAYLAGQLGFEHVQLPANGVVHVAGLHGSLQASMILRMQDLQGTGLSCQPSLCA